MRDGTFGPETIKAMGEGIVVPIGPVMDVIGRYALLPSWDSRHEVVSAVRECLVENARIVVPDRCYDCPAWVRPARPTDDGARMRG